MAIYQAETPKMKQRKRQRRHKLRHPHAHRMAPPRTTRHDSRSNDHTETTPASAVTAAAAEHGVTATVARPQQERPVVTTQGGSQLTLEAKLALPIERLGLPTRATNALRGEGIRIIGDLTRRTRASLVQHRIGNFGDKSIKAAAEKLAAMGLAYADDPQPVNPTA